MCKKSLLIFSISFILALSIVAFAQDSAQVNLKGDFLPNRSVELCSNDSELFLIMCQYDTQNNCYNIKTAKSDTLSLNIMNFENSQSIKGFAFESLSSLKPVGIPKVIKKP